MKLISIFFLLLLASACSSTGGGGSQQQEHQVDTLASAKVHTELAALYYGQQRYAVALEELKIAL